VAVSAFFSNTFAFQTQSVTDGRDMATRVFELSMHGV
jgi:cytidylate kinase